MFTLVPPDFQVPEKHINPVLVLKKLTAQDAYTDYITVMANAEFIRRTRGGSWPSDQHTFEDNMIDVCWFHREFEQKSTFAYGVWDIEMNTYLGCVYFYWPGSREETASEADVDISFWVTQEAYDKGLYEQLYNILSEWIEKEWPFEYPHWSNAKLPEA